MTASLRRRRLPQSVWPVADQMAWSAMFEARSPLDPDGSLAAWSSASRDLAIGAYAGWLRYCARRHPQLGVYQLAVLIGAFEQFGLSEPGGAELIQVGKAALTARARVQRQGALAEDPEPAWAKDLVETVAAGMAGPVFRARVNPGCRTCPVASCCPVNPEGEQVTP